MVNIKVSNQKDLSKTLVNINYDTKINKASIVDSLEGDTNVEWTRNTLR
jgi:hypothetical protein